MKTLLLVALGGGIGSVLRYGLSELVRVHAPSSFPWSTVAVNVSGCLVIGLLAGLWSDPAREPWRVFLLVGVLGGYTTFSTFGKETVTLVTEQRYAAAAGYVLMSNLLGLGAAFLGAALARR